MTFSAADGPGPVGAPFTCANCGKVQTRTQSHEDALAEMKAAGMPDDDALVEFCDDCYNAFMLWQTQQEYKTRGIR